jgi:hypothetical protein
VVADKEITGLAIRCTQIVCGEPERVVCALPALSVIENVDAAAKLDSRGFVSPGSAVDCTEIVHTSSLVWVIELIREIRVNLKSTPSTIDNVEQTIDSLPVTVKVKVATPELPVERPKVTTGAVRSPPTTDVVVEVELEEVEDVVEVDAVVVEVEEDEVDVVFATVVVGATVVVEATDVEVVVAVTTLTVFALTSRHRNCFLTFETQTTRLPATLSRAPSRTQTPPRFTDSRLAATSADEPTPPNTTPPNNTATKLARNPNFTEKQHPI